MTYGINYSRYCGTKIYSVVQEDRYGRGHNNRISVTTRPPIYFIRNMNCSVPALLTTYLYIICLYIYLHICLYLLFCFCYAYISGIIGACQWVSLVCSRDSHMSPFFCSVVKYMARVMIFLSD